MSLYPIALPVRPQQLLAASARIADHDLIKKVIAGRLTETTEMISPVDLVH